MKELGKTLKVDAELYQLAPAKKSGKVDDDLPSKSRTDRRHGPEQDSFKDKHEQIHSADNIEMPAG